MSCQNFLRHCHSHKNYPPLHEITNYFEVGKMGIEHALLPEQGLIVAGETCIGADSHTCTYGASTQRLLLVSILLFFYVGFLFLFSY